VEEQISFLDGGFSVSEAAQQTFFPQLQLPQQIIDEALCMGFNDRDSRKIICAYFMKDKPDNAAFLQESYGTNGAGLIIQGQEYAVWYDPEGIRISTGRTVKKLHTTLVTWEQAAKRIRELLDMGRYMPQKYLQYNTLKENDLLHFDAWASTFGETVTAIELAPEGTGYRAKTRFAKFYNLPELMSMFKEIADIQTADMLKLPVPEAEYHNVVLKPSEQQKEIVASLSERAEKVRNKQVDSNEDNMLVITNDGRKLALDQELNWIQGDSISAGACQRCCPGTHHPGGSGGAWKTGPDCADRHHLGCHAANSRRRH